MTPRLVKMTAPEFWSRWAVIVDGTPVGYLEKRTRMTGWWTAYDSDWHRIGAENTRTAALARVLAGR